MRQTWRGNEREMVGKEKERERNGDRQGGKESETDKEGE